MNQETDNLHSVAFLSSRSRNNVVKISFHSNYAYKSSEKTNLRMNILIGDEIAKQLKWKNKDHIEIKVGDNKIVLNKMDSLIDDDVEYKKFKGYKIRKVRASYSFVLSIKAFIEPTNLRIRTLPHTITRGTDLVKYLTILWED